MAIRSAEMKLVRYGASYSREAHFDSDSGPVQLYLNQRDKKYTTAIPTTKRLKREY